MEAVTNVEKLAALVSSGKTAEPLLLGIDGFDGTGKTTLAFALAKRLIGIRIGLDSYIQKSREADRYVGLLRLEDLARDLNALSRCFQYVVIDGVCLLEALAAIGTQ